MRFRKQMSLLLLCATASLLGGCGIGTTVPAAGTTYTGAVLQGKLYGGQQPIAGARVYLLAAGVGGYGGASVSLLNAAVTGNADSVGAYVLTGPTGSFTISGDYTCTGGSQVYLYALGGNPGTGTNSAAATMALLGGCPAGGKFTNIPLVTMNEVSTVAAAYAVAGYATDALHISSSGTPLAKTGIANAFANATNLVDLGLGTSLATTPGGNGTVPQTEINTLADILASCVNTSNTSTGAASASCSALFALATSDGTSTGTQPAETATAAINIAHHPALNVSALYAMNGGTTSPFQPILAVPPNDWTVRLAFSSGYGGTNDEQGHSLAVDGSGNIWAVEPYCQAAMTAPQVYTCVASSQI